ncbi:transmembrane protein 222-like [Vespa mandarinia]|uniref:transmembrane protein 222-like n=1 Tax=Vespa mandarinia TaxID=7446 RepID=UPI001622D195|nr:transmembrane protein 222-like [Vespa mandarinia]XP_046816824.1 transmembrane protein 222 [Vespa crabro]
MNPDLLTNVISESTPSSPEMDLTINPERQRFPFCIVWTPLPIITYLIPFIGHMGICTSTGVIRDFAGPYHVAEDHMAFGKPIKYWQLQYTKAKGGVQGWDMAVSEASEIYKTRMHNLFFDNCHSHVAKALNLMAYDNSTNWNMVKLAAFILVKGKYVNFYGFLKNWLPFFILVIIIMILDMVFNL